MKNLLIALLLVSSLYASCSANYCSEPIVVMGGVGYGNSTNYASTVTVQMVGSGNSTNYHADTRYIVEPTVAVPATPPRVQGGGGLLITPQQLQVEIGKIDILEQASAFLLAIYGFGAGLPWWLFALIAIVLLVFFVIRKSLEREIRMLFEILGLLLARLRG